MLATLLLDELLELDPLEPEPDVPEPLLDELPESELFELVPELELSELLLPESPPLDDSLFGFSDLPPDEPLLFDRESVR
ncbi:MAG: hypothetical protein WCA46_13265 [Actinocatenispora sp.]